MAEALDVFFELLNEKKIKHYVREYISDKGIFIDDAGLRSLLRTGCTGFAIENKNIIAGVISQDNIYIVSDDMLCTYVLFSYEKNRLIIIGPYRTEPTGISIVRAMLKKRGISLNRSDEMVQFFSTLPEISDASMWESMLLVLGRRIFNKEIKLNREYITSVGQEAIKYVFDDAGKNNSDFDDIEYRYNMQLLFIKALSAGDLDGAREMLRRMSLVGGVEKRTDNIIRDERNMLIVFNTMCRFAMSEAGVHPKYIDRLSREFSMRIEAASTSKLLADLRKEMLIRYCEAVRSNIKIKNPKLKRVVAYIKSNYMQQLTLAEVAAEFDITPNYLSKELKKETGFSFIEFLNDYRLDVAKRLLSRTDYPVNDVAAMCGYLDNNYFSRIFKRQTGCSPRDFRKNNRV